MKGVRMTEAELLEYQRRQRELRNVDVDLKIAKRVAVDKALGSLERGLIKKVSPLEIRFAQQLADRGLHDDYVHNYLDAIQGRNFELDFAWPQLRFAVEIDGMAHRTKGRFVADFEKHALLLLEGWKILRVCGKDVREGRAIAWTMELLRRAP